MNSASVVALIYEHLGRQEREELTRLARLVEAACAAQREQCAKLCEQIATQHLSSGRYLSVIADHSVRAGGQVDGAEECARAIRS